MARAWWASERPCQPRRMVSTAMASRVRNPGSPASSTSMETSLSNSTARSKTTRTCSTDIGLGVFNPGDAADHVGAQLHRLAHQVQCARFAHEAILGEGHHLDVHDVP